MPLVIPEGSSKIGVVIGIDPGSSSLGLACIYLDIETLEIVKTTAITIKPEKCLRSEAVSEVHGARYARIYALTDILYDIFLEHMPIDLISESPFMSRRQPMAYGALMEVVYATRLALSRYNPNMALYLIDPPSAKQAVGAAGNAGKEDVLKAVAKLEEELKYDKTLSNDRDLMELDEHSSDAIAITYSMINKYRGK